MKSLASDRRAELAARPDLLRTIRRGIEKEGLRVDSAGNLAGTPHPAALGAALTNPHITTDYSESLLELITSPIPSANALIDDLTDIHTYVAHRNPDEAIWNQSMPAHLPPEADIPVAWYGTSNTGMLKHVYRLGLAWRYGKIMQCIAGVHYNYSLPEVAWDLLAAGDTAQVRRNNGYMGLIRNFMRHSWLLMYLFGASPAVSRSFLQRAGFETQLTRLSPDTYCLPWATSLRMSDLGYKSPTQSDLQLCYNDLDTFTARIYTACTTPWPAYEAIGTHRDGQRIQLNTNILQIENEYYSSIRPKQTAGRCERPNTILRERGIQYIEVRCMDIDPWAPAGIRVETARFLDAFLLCCAVEDSPLFPPPGNCGESQENFARVAREGRRPGLTLTRDGQTLAMKDWAEQALSAIEPYARLLDEGSGDTQHRAALEAQKAKIADPDTTPSARLLAALHTEKREFHDWTLTQSQAHWANLKARQLSAAALAAFDRAARDSIAEQARLEASDTESFEQYVARFHAALQ
ncbi:MAG: glutamate--cysteine ligase [Castellaniella sp.]|uniref:glutamate--cysteine ligase n=1 Tax=Castellaniella sp. TaxID=1955812 RepID=UPI00121C00B9|nr:glutamate--cysteine ligase [Castellaniella sp.]TAN27186.1 MAG: glutamate--cysteine ligase [Castellaniella sp.]